MRHLRCILSIAATAVIAAALSLPVIRATEFHRGQSCPENWIGVPCNGHNFCNYTGHDFDIPGCGCDLNNICRDGG